MDSDEHKIIALIDAIEHKITEEEHSGISEHTRLEIEYLINDIVATYKYKSVDNLIEECYKWLDTI